MKIDVIHENPTPPGGAEEILERFETHRHSLTAYLFVILRNWTWVEEALQESSIYLSEHWRDFEAGTNFSAWIKTIASYRAKEVLAREKRQRKIAFRMAERMEIQSSESIEPELQHSVALELCLKRLKSKARSLIQLKYDMSYNAEEIAKITNSTIHAVYMNLSRIRQQLKKCIESHSAP